MDIKCSNKECGYYEKDNFIEPICPALAVDEAIENFVHSANESSKDTAATDAVASKLSYLKVKGERKENEKATPSLVPKFEPRPNPLADIITSLSPIMTDEMRAEPVPEIKDLPYCPKCSSLLRPAVV